MRNLLVVLIVMCGGLISAALAADDGPWPSSTLNCRRYYAVEADAKAPDQTAVVEFATGNVMDAKGSDVRVMAAGKAVPSRVLCMGPGSVCRVAFRVVPGVRDYYVLYGLKNAVPEGPAWEPESGLLLETRQFNGGNIDSVEGVMRAVQKSGPSFGANMVLQVFHGTNPFGPSDNYVSIYKGWLFVPQQGVYQFATSSDDASVMKIDGMVVCRKLGEDRAYGDARAAGDTVTLTAGKHRFEYYHVELEGDQAAVGAWKPPGGKFALIPPEAFGIVHRPKLASFTIRGQPVAPDVRAINFGEVILNRKQMTRFSFRNETTAPDALQYQPRWEFGDGTRSDSPNPEHVYFEFATYDVSLTLTRGGKSYRIDHTIIVDEGWDRQTVPSHDTTRQYYGIIKGYQFDKMKLEHVDRAMDVFEEMQQPGSGEPPTEEIIRAAGAMLARKAELTDEIYVRHALQYAEALCRANEQREKQPAAGDADGDRSGRTQLPDDPVAAALSVLAEAERRVQQPELRVKAALKRADVLFYYARDLAKAVAEYERIVKTWGWVKGNEPRIAQVRIGDYFRKLGKTADARSAYQKAATMIPQRDYKQKAAHLGAWQESVESFLRDGNLIDARAQLDAWEWEEPEAKLDSRSSLLRAELAVKEKNVDESIVQLTDFITGNKDGAFAPEALLTMARLHIDCDRPDAAVPLLEKLPVDYKDSPLKEDAAFLLAEVLLKQKRAEKAIRQIAEFRASYPDSDRQPSAMLLHGDCLRAAGQEEKARAAWAELIKKYPQSEERKAAEERVK